MEQPPPGFPLCSKKKRGRPIKSPTHAVGTPVPPVFGACAPGTGVPTAPTPQNKRVQKSGFVLEHLGLSELKPPSRLDGFGTAPTPQNKTVTKPEFVGENTPDLSKLKPPSRSDGFRTGEEIVNLLKKASLILISGIKEAKNANEMIELSSKAFAYFDSIEVDYMPLYKVVCSVIQHYCDKEALEKQKPHAAFNTKALHNEAMCELSEAKERYTRVNIEFEDVQCDLDAIRARVKQLCDELKMGKEKQAKLEAEVAAAQANKVTCDETCFKAKANVEKLGLKMSEAQKAIDEFERRWKETSDGLNRAMGEASSL